MNESELDTLLEAKFAKYFGQITTHLSKQLKAEIDPIRTDVQHIRSTLDAGDKRIETDEQERAAMNGQLDRHETWIEQLAEKTGTNLVPELFRPR